MIRPKNVAVIIVILPNRLVAAISPNPNVRTVTRTYHIESIMDLELELYLSNSLMSIVNMETERKPEMMAKYIGCLL